MVKLDPDGNTVKLDPNGNDVTVGNTDANPVIVKEANAVSREPFSHRLSVGVDLGNTRGSSDPYIVPADNRLVIEYAGGSVQNFDGNDNQLLAVTLNGYPLTLTQLYDDFQMGGGNYDGYTFAQPMKIYVEPGDSVALLVVRSSDQAYTTVEASISGYLEDVQ